MAHGRTRPGLKDAAQRAGTTSSDTNTGRMTASARDMLDLELALLRRGLDERLAGSERCTCCHRTPLVGERVYVYASGTIACELCRAGQRDVPQEDRIVHGPEFGHTMRIVDRRAAA
jgi:hypothetical protein